MHSNLKLVAHALFSNLTTFIKCAEAVIEENRQQGLRNELSASYVATQQQVIRYYITEFFKDYDIKDVDYAALNTFKTFLYDKDIKPATIALQFAALKKVINYAEMHKFIPTRPIFPKIKNVQMHVYHLLKRNISI
jgi:integrase